MLEATERFPPTAVETADLPRRGALEADANVRRILVADAAMVDDCGFPFPGCRSSSRGFDKLVSIEARCKSGQTPNYSAFDSGLACKQGQRNRHKTKKAKDDGNRDGAAEGPKEPPRRRFERLIY